jgi:hypothetical protein
MAGYSTRSLVIAFSIDISMIIVFVWSLEEIISEIVIGDSVSPASVPGRSNSRM